MSAATPLFNHTLDSVAQAFDHSRSTRSGRSHTPVNLRRRAAALLGSYPASHICSALKVNDTALKRWAAGSSPDAPADPSVAQPSFVELPAVPASVYMPSSEPGCQALSVEFGDGIKLHLRGDFTPEQILDAAHRHQLRSTIMIQLLTRHGFYYASLPLTSGRE